MSLARMSLVRSLLAALLLPMTACAATPTQPSPPQPSPPLLVPTEHMSTGSVDVGGRRIEYKAVAGTLVVHPAKWSDAPQEPDSKNPTAVASMSYFAYFAAGAKPAERPITFLYNGGPGSSTMWLHMGAFGPRRVVTRDAIAGSTPPYTMVDNDQSLLDVSDLVFVDAPGTGLGRVAGKDAEKAFYGVDQDVHAFASFITQFATKFGRWPSPKYLFGESYGTPRSAALVDVLQEREGMSVNGVIMLSQILNYALSIDGPKFDPGVDLPYQLALPSFAAAAWYHHRLPGPQPAQLDPLLREVERFAMTDYAAALAEGSELDGSTRKAIAATLHRYTGLPEAYLLKADLRIDGGEFEHALQQDADATTGRFDARFSGPVFDPLAQRAAYDPMSAALRPAYVAALNDYLRSALGYGAGETYKAEIDVEKDWDFRHQPPGAESPLAGPLNVMPDLAAAMTANPRLAIMVNGGWFDLATPFYEGWYEMHHLPMRPALGANIEYRYYPAGHMVYINPESLKALHDNVAAFVRRTAAPAGRP